MLAPIVGDSRADGVESAALTSRFLEPALIEGAEPRSDVENETVEAPRHKRRAANQDPADIARFEDTATLAPVEGDYIYPVFRALSASVIPGYWLDYSGPGVLQESTAMLTGQTVYKNHDFMDVEQWVGVVNRSFWDPEGKQSGDVSGINVEMKIDWRMNPRIARGLLMQPPAIHSASVTVLFEYEYSHPQMTAEGRFWDSLGEVVDGQLVRLIVTKILGYWEISLVFQGADQLAKQIPELNGRAEEFSLAKVTSEKKPESIRMAEFSKSTLDALGLDMREGAEITQELLTTRLKQLVELAETGEYMVAVARNEALRVVRLANANDDFESAVPIERLIETATPKELEEITKFYSLRIARGFPNTCQSCGATSHTVRSSVENGLDGHATVVERVIANSLH